MEMTLLRLAVVAALVGEVAANGGRCYFPNRVHLTCNDIFARRGAMGLTGYGPCVVVRDDDGDVISIEGDLVLGEDRVLKEDRYDSLGPIPNVIETFSCPKLQKIAGTIIIADMPNLVSISLPRLTDIGTDSELGHHCSNGGISKGRGCAGNFGYGVAGNCSPETEHCGEEDGCHGGQRSEEELSQYCEIQHVRKYCYGLDFAQNSWVTPYRFVQENADFAGHQSAARLGPNGELNAPWDDEYWNACPLAVENGGPGGVNACRGGESTGQVNLMTEGAIQFDELGPTFSNGYATNQVWYPVGMTAQSLEADEGWSPDCYTPYENPCPVPANPIPGLSENGMNNWCPAPYHPVMSWEGWCPVTFFDAMEGSDGSPAAGYSLWTADGGICAGGGCPSEVGELYTGECSGWSYQHGFQVPWGANNNGVYWDEYQRDDHWSKCAEDNSCCQPEEIALYGCGKALKIFGNPNLQELDLRALDRLFLGSMYGGYTTQNLPDGAPDVFYFGTPECGGWSCAADPDTYVPWVNDDGHQVAYITQNHPDLVLYACGEWEFPEAGPHGMGTYTRNGCAWDTPDQRIVTCGEYNAEHPNNEYTLGVCNFATDCAGTWSACT
eukprot:COSAG02_NODE_8372_length_2595_cov_10.989978_1_plen_609_part_10